MQMQNHLANAFPLKCEAVIGKKRQVWHDVEQTVHFLGR